MVRRVRDFIFSLRSGGSLKRAVEEEYAGLPPFLSLMDVIDCVGIPPLDLSHVGYGGAGAGGDGGCCCFRGC